MNQIGTDISRKGDLISARVLSPASLQGDFIEGRVAESKSGAKLGGKSVFAVNFDTLRHGSSVIAISSQFKSAVNSKGKANVDEEGRIVRRATGNVAKAAGGTGAGALVGGILGGGRGAAIGAAVGGATSIALIQLAADSPNIHFNAGSRFVIDASTRDGSSLLALPRSTPNPTHTSSSAANPVQVDAAPPSEPVQAASAASNQPELTTLKSTFIPGDKTIFYDDFTDMSADDAPPHFKVRGTATELKAAGPIRQLNVLQRSTLTPNLASLPKNFTFEAEMKVDSSKRALAHLILFSGNKELLVFTNATGLKECDFSIALKAPYQFLGRKRFPVNWREPVKVALWLQNGRIRAYLDGEKQLDFNQVDLPDITRVDLVHEIYAGDSIGYRSVRFAESTPDFSQVIASSGRYVSRGIRFDTGSDRIQAESAPVIQWIAKGLEANPALRFLIEGHTDSTGDAAQNLDLSQRRAEAVKAALVTQFKIDDARLSTAGLGSTKPIDANDTPQGRSQNRRVEFVKQ